MKRLSAGLIGLTLVLQFFSLAAQQFCDGDCYDLLGLTQRATKEDIKRVYKKFSLQYHPDKKPGAANIEKFKKIAQAYEVLIDDKTRRKYDYEIRNPSGFVSHSGGFVGQTGQVDGKIIWASLGACVCIFLIIVVSFLKKHGFFKRQVIQKKPKKVNKKAGAGLKTA